MTTSSSPDQTPTVYSVGLLFRGEAFDRMAEVGFYRQGRYESPSKTPFEKGKPVSITINAIDRGEDPHNYGFDECNNDLNQPDQPVVKTLDALMLAYASSDPRLDIWRRYPDISEVEDACTDSFACEQASTSFVEFARAQGWNAVVILAEEAEHPMADYHVWVRIWLGVHGYDVDWTARQYHNLHETFGRDEGVLSLPWPLVWASSHEHPVVGQFARLGTPNLYPNTSPDLLEIPPGTPAELVNVLRGLLNNRGQHSCPGNLSEEAMPLTRLPSRNEYQPWVPNKSRSTKNTPTSSITAQVKCRFCVTAKPGSGRNPVVSTVPKLGSQPPTKSSSFAKR